MAVAREQLGQSAPALARAASGRRSSPRCLQQVVGDEHHRHLVEDLAAQGLPADAALQLRERQRRVAGPGQQLAVDARSRRAGARPASSTSGNRPFSSSSPRDQRKVRPARRISCARMPSHFHSASHSATVAEAIGRPLPAGRPGRTDRAGSRRRRGRPARTRRAKNSGVGSQPPMSRWAIAPSVDAARLRPAPAPPGRADTPTRKAPVISLFQTKRSRRSSSRQARTISSRCTASS